MGNLFDDLQASTFETVSDVFGFDATWQPAEGGDAHEARVLFKDPAGDEDIFKNDPVGYQRLSPVMEWYDGDFPELASRVRDRHHEKVTITIAGTERTYQVLNAKPIHDGRTYRAELQIDNE